MKEKQLLKTIVEGIQEKKGKKITTVDLSKIESAAPLILLFAKDNRQPKSWRLPIV